MQRGWNSAEDLLRLSDFRSPAARNCGGGNRSHFAITQTLSGRPHSLLGSSHAAHRKKQRPRTSASGKKPKRSRFPLEAAVWTRKQHL